MKSEISRKLNFNAGPAAMPAEVLQEAAEAVMEYNNSGLSILEIPHRGKAFTAIVDESKQLVKELCGLNDDYEIMWLQGGGRMQFCMVPMNFLGEKETAAYIDTDHWSNSAIQYAKYYGQVDIVASSKEDKYRHLPPWPEKVSPASSYLHFTTNNTIYGTQWQNIPSCNVPLIADMSSDILCSKRNYSNCAMFYAVAQKNLGAAGASLAVLRKDMLQRIKRELPSMLNYNEHAKANSVLNTPSVFAIYTALLMLRWTKNKGIENIEKDNRQKAAMLYTELERNPLFDLYVTKAEDRSMMNICFTAVSPEIESTFLKFCEDRNITGIKGHRSVGGFRVSLYNGVTVEATTVLRDAMQEFEKSAGL